MAQLCVSKGSLCPPNITPANLEAFYQAHFSTRSLSHFNTNFLGPVPVDSLQEEDEDDDELGYYPDGVKRTLTDEQIAMFRHSEIQALLKERRHTEENEAAPTREDDKVAETEEGELEDGEEAPIPEPEQQRPAKKSRPQSGVAAKRQKTEQRRERGHKQPPKPDLRKRTWDRVDRGLQSLDYGEEDEGAAAAPTSSQRRRISYEDV